MLMNHTLFFYQNPSQLVQQRCDNFVTTLWLMLAQHCGKIENERCGELWRGQFSTHCDNVATTLTNGCLGAF